MRRIIGETMRRAAWCGADLPAMVHHDKNEQRWDAVEPPASECCADAARANANKRCSYDFAWKGT